MILRVWSLHISVDRLLANIKYAVTTQGTIDFSGERIRTDGTISRFLIDSIAVDDCSGCNNTQFGENQGI